MIGRAWRALRLWSRDAGGFVLQRPIRLAAVGGGLVLGFFAGAPIGDAAYDYTWRDPNFCGDCHVHDYANENYFRSVHGGVTTCHDCHKVPLLHYPLELWIMVTGPPETPEDVGPTHVPSVLCGACHLEGSQEELTGPMTEELRPQIVKVDHSPLHRIHLEATTRDPGPYRGAHSAAAGLAQHKTDAPRGLSEETGAMGCLDCHGSGGDLETHRFTAARSNCVSCHGALDVAGGRLKQLSCQECHLAGFVGRRP